MEPETSYAYLDSPLGLIEIAGTPDAVASVTYVDSPRQDVAASGAVAEAQGQFEQYLTGARRVFDLRLSLEGTPFQLRVWAQMLAIPLGSTVSYQAVARALGMTHGARAVGAAAGQNRLPVLVPCHRVVGSRGGLTGYAGGLWRKEWLLRHEAAILV